MKDPSGKKIATPKLTDKGTNLLIKLRCWIIHYPLGNGKFELEFTPSDKGAHTVEVLLEGKPVEGSPLSFTVDPKPWYDFTLIIEYIRCA